MPNHDHRGELTTEVLLDFLNKMPLDGDDEIVCKYGENPHSALSPAYNMFEENRDRWNVLGFVRVSEVMAHPLWSKQEAALWALGLSMPGGRKRDLPGGISQSQWNGPCLIHQESKRKFLLWVDTFLRNSPDSQTPFEWIESAKEKGGSVFARQALNTNGPLRALWGEARDNDCSIEGERQIEENFAEAESLETDKSFVEVDWTHFGGLSYETMGKVVAASVGANPEHPCSNINWAKEYLRYVTGHAAIKLKQLVERRAILDKNLSTMGGKVEVKKLPDTGRLVIEIKGFAELAIRMGWHLPNRFPGQPAISEQDKHHAANTSEAIPGKLGRSSIVKAAIEIAWEIEKKTGKIASPKAVREKLKEYSNNGDRYSDFLITKKDSDDVWWRPTGSKIKPWYASSCETALKRWKDTL